jgi:hypothetical protein
VSNQESESKVDNHRNFIIGRDFDVPYVMLFVTMVRSIAFQVTRGWTQSADANCGFIDSLTRYWISLPETPLHELAAAPPSENGCFQAKLVVKDPQAYHVSNLVATKYLARTE